MTGIHVIAGVLLCIGCVLADDSTTVQILHNKKDVSELRAENGKDVDFECVVENRPEASTPGGTPPKVVWNYKPSTESSNWLLITSNAESEDSSKYEIKEENQKQVYTLKVKSLRPDSAGSYQCIIQTQPESFVSDEVELKIVEKPMISAIDSTKEKTAHVGDMDVVFHCAAKGTPTPNFFWKKKGATSGLTGNVTESSLVFGKITPEHAGDYVCEAKNDVGSDYWTVTLKVTSPPSITPPLDNTVSQALGYKAFIVCEVEANPRPQKDDCTWSFGGKPVTAATEKESNGGPFARIIPKVGGATMTLTIPEVKKEHVSQDYVCSASNTFGTKTATITLKKADYPLETRAGPANGGARVYISVATIFSVLCAVFL